MTLLSFFLESLLEKEVATHSSVLAWRILWTEGPGGLWSMGCKESDTTEQLTHTQTHPGFSSSDGFIFFFLYPFIFFWKKKSENSKCHF